MIIINFVETITHRHRENMAKLDFFDQSKFKSERNQLQYFVNPIYFINLLILLQSLLKLKIPIIYSFTQQVLTVLSSNIALYFHMLLFAILLLGLMLPQQFKQFSFLLRLVFKNYDRVFLIPLQIISFNQMNQTNQIINSIAIYILCVNQVSFFSPLHFLSSNLNRTNTKLALLKPLVIQQIIIYTQLQVIHQYLGYFLLLYLLCVLLEIITERISYYNYLATNDCYLYTTAICILLIDFIPNQNDQLYVFCVILTFSLNVVHIIVLRIEYIIATRPNTVSFLQILYITHTKQALDAEKTLQFLILKEIHYFNCMDIKCICKRKNLLFEQDLHQVLNAQIVRLLKAERIKMNYIFFLFDITKNMVKGLQFILSQKSQILTTFYIVVLQIIQEQIQHNLIEETIKGKNPFMDEIKSLKLDGPILQKVTSQVYDAKVQLYEKIINRQIINFQQFFNEILHLQTQVLTLMDVCQQLMIWHNKQVHNIFSLRICLLVANIIQDLKEKASIQSFINDLIQQEVYKQDSFTNIAFTSNNAISLSANLDKWAEFTHPITGRQLKFLELERAPQSITQLLHPNFQGPHQKLIEAYLRKGKSTIIGNQLDTTFSPNQNSLIPVKMVLYPYFPKMRLDSYQLIAYLSKIEYINHGIIHLDLNFSIQCVNRGFVKFLETYHLTPNRINIFQMIPSLKDTFVQFHQQEMKTLYMQNQTIQIQQISVGGDSIKSKSMSLSKKFDRGAQMSYLETFRYMTITSNQLEESQQIDYELSFHQIKYETDEGDEYYIYYKLVIDLGQLGDEQQEDGKANTSNNKRFKKTPNSDQNKDLLRSLHSKASTSSSEKIGDDLLRQISNSSVPPSLRFFIIVSFIAVSFAIASLLIIYFLLLQKRSQQDVCFDRLFYGTEFLDYYALILKGSRHTVFYRDFNKYVPNQQTIDVADYDVTIAEKISLSLLLYQNNCKELIQLYENYLSYLNSYQDQKEINFKYVDYYVTKVQIQIVETQAKYYEIMNQLFYLALKTFAGDPSAYLKGNLDSFAQINTRSILFLNFNDVCDLTQQFIESCLFNSQQYNNTFDGQVQIAFYIMHFVAVSLFAMLLLSIKATIKRMKQIIQIFLRMDNRDIEEDKEMLLYVLKNIKDEEFWFNSKFFVQFFEKSQDYQHKKDFAEKIVNLKLDDAFNLPLYYVLQSFIYILMFIFFLQFQLQYNNYSNEINPIVNQALSAVQIRLNFVKIVSNWDVYNYQTFYKSFHDQDFMTKNIQHDTLIYSLIKINYTELSQSIVSALQEPFSDMTNGLSDELRDQLLIKDICLLMNCTLEKEIFQDRLLQNELSANFKIGLIQLYKQTIQVIENLGLMEVNSSNSEEFLYTFLNSVYSKEYFLYIFWGLDATNYELKLFSDYFISIAKDKLTSQTQNIISILFGVGLTIIIIIMGITIVLGYKIFICYNSLKYCLRFIPFKTMLNKNIIKQIKMII